MSIKPTKIQKRARSLLAGAALYILLLGGSRSGKTFILIYAIVYRAIKAPGSRHCVIRHRFNSVKTSIIMDTFPKVMKICFPGCANWTLNKTDWFVTFENGSEIWFFGLDDEQRADKILGKEYTTIYFNEASEVSYAAYSVAVTRLAQNVPGLINKIYVDCNPPSKHHWLHKLFIEHIDPISGEDKHAPHYADMLMNPIDNVENLAPGYIENFLESLPPNQRKRFLLGQWGVPEGLVFDMFPYVPEGWTPEDVLYGLDFGFKHPMALIEVGCRDGEYCLDELFYESGKTVERLIQHMDKLGISKTAPVIADGSRPEDIQRICLAGYNCMAAKKGPGSVLAGIDIMQSRKIFVTRRSKNVIKELMAYEWEKDRNGIVLERPIKAHDDAIDGSRYAIMYDILKKENIFQSIGSRRPR